jgi:hypothetical protein
MAGGAVVTNCFASIAALGERLWFRDTIAKHNSGEKHFSDQHEIFCIGNVSPEAVGDENFLYCMEHSQPGTGTRVGKAKLSLL